MAKESGIKIAELSQISRPSIKNKILIGDIRPPQINKISKSKKMTESVFDGVEMQEGSKNKTKPDEEINPPKEKNFYRLFDKETFRK